MKVSEIVKLLEAEIICCDSIVETTQVKAACGSDMMSDVLAYVKDQGLLLTGLVNPQVVRTAEMMDMLCIVFVRGKRPDETVIKLAESKNIIILCSKFKMFKACGVLFKAGLGEGAHASD